VLLISQRLGKYWTLGMDLPKSFFFAFVIVIDCVD
jgi:hypothetical protein